MKIIALEYHDVVPQGRWDESGFPGAAAASYKMSVERFEDHLRELARITPVITINPEDAKRASSPPVMLTFDDGGAGYMAHAADRLERQGWRGCVFVTTAEIGKPGFLTSADLRSLSERGHLVGTHSRSHPVRMSALSPAEIREEWRSSVAELGAALGTAVTAGSVPGGYHSRVVAEAAAAEGLTILFTSEPESTTQRVNGCEVIGRFTLRQNDPGAYAAKLVTDPTARLAQWGRWNAKKLVKAVGGNAYLRIRERMLNR